LLVLTATALIAASGACLAIQQHKIALRLFCAGIAVAATSAMTRSHFRSTPADQLAALAALAAAAGLCAALIFNSRRMAVYLILAGISGWIVAATFTTTINWLWRNWWIIPIALLVPCAAALIARAWMEGMGDRIRRPNQANSIARLLSRLFFGGARRGLRRRNRHIGNIGMAKRSRRGAGPNMI
jgi:hypothetical protein